MIRHLIETVKCKTGAALKRWKPVTPLPAHRTGPRLNMVTNLKETWILHYFAKAVMEHSSVPYNLVHHPEWPHLRENSPAHRDASGTFYIHYSLYRDYLRRGRPKDDVVFFTHFHPNSPESESHELAEMLSTLHSARLIISMSSYWRDRLVAWGLPADKIAVELVGSDANRFTPGPARIHTRPRVGLVSSYKDIKNAPFIRDIVRRHRHVDWLLLGRYWRERTALLDDLRDCMHFEYVDLSEAAFEHWPEIYRRLDLFVSPSLVEGGPVPLLEAMLTGVWPIASDTGHARDVITEGQTGFIYPVDDHAAFDRCLEKSLALNATSRTRVREAVLPLTWERFGRAIDCRVVDALQLGAPL